MAPLVVLLVVFALALAMLRRHDAAATGHAGHAGRIALAAMFVFTGVSHFLFTQAMVEMLPPFVPERTLVVRITGVLEGLGGVGLLVPGLRRLAAGCLAVFLVGVFPANVYAAMNAVGMGGHVEGPAYLWFRAPLQLFFLVWTVHFGLRNGAATRSGTPPASPAGARP